MNRLPKSQTSEVLSKEVHARDSDFSAEADGDVAARSARPLVIVAAIVQQVLFAAIVERQGRGFERAEHWTVDRSMLSKAPKPRTTAP